MDKVNPTNRIKRDVIKHQNKLLCLLLLASVIALYAGFLSNPLVFDDLYYFMLDDEGNQRVSTFHFELFQIRSLPYATLAWTKAWFGLDLINFRIGNLLLHAGVVLALFFFLATLFTTVIGDNQKESLSPRTAAFFAALLFALHPVSSYAVAYLIQRGIVMATLFSLLGLLAYLQGSIRQKPVWLWLSVPCYFFAVYAKEQAIMLPAVLLGLTVLLHKDWRQQLKARWGIFLAMLVIAVLVTVSVKGLIGSVYIVPGTENWGETERQISYPMSILMQSQHFLKYAFLWVLPNPAWMSIDMPQPFPQSLFSTFLLAFLVFLAWGALAFWLLFKRGLQGLAGFALLSPWLMFLVEFSVVRIQDVFVLYRSFLWAPLAFCLLPVIFAKLNGRTAAAILSLLALTMIPLSMDRLMTLSHPYLVWDDAEKLVTGRTDLPGSFRIYYNRGTEAIHIDRPDQAIADLKQAIALSPRFAEAHGNLGAAYFNKADWNNAVAAFDKAITIAHEDHKTLSPRYIHGRAQAFEKLGEFEKAQQDYRESCRLASRGCEKLR